MHVWHWYNILKFSSQCKEIIKLLLISIRNSNLVQLDRWVTWWPLCRCPEFLCTSRPCMSTWQLSCLPFSCCVTGRTGIVRFWSDNLRWICQSPWVKFCFWWCHCTVCGLGFVWCSIGQLLWWIDSEDALLVEIPHTQGIICLSRCCKNADKYHRSLH